MEEPAMIPTVPPNTPRAAGSQDGARRKHELTPLPALQMLRSVLNATALFPERRSGNGISSSARRVLLTLAALTYGWQKSGDRIGMTQLIGMTGMSKQAVSKALRELEAMKILISARTHKGRGDIPLRRLDANALFAAAGYAERVKTLLTLFSEEGSTLDPEKGKDIAPKMGQKGNPPLDTPMKCPSDETYSDELPRGARGISRLSDADLQPYLDRFSRISYSWVHTKDMRFTPDDKEQMKKLAKAYPDFEAFIILTRNFFQDENRDREKKTLYWLLRDHMKYCHEEPKQIDGADTLERNEALWTTTGPDPGAHDATQNPLPDETGRQDQTQEGQNETAT